jgi:cell division transport system permease protein
MKNALTGVERAMFWTLVFAAFAAAVAGLAARGVDRMAASYEEARHGYAIVRVLAPEGAAGMAAAESALTHAPHVTSAAPMTAGRAAALLAQWGGQSVNGADMPDLRLIEIDLAASPPNTDVSGDIVAALAQGGVTAEVIEAPDNASGGGLATRVRAAALWGAIAFGALMALIVSLSARGLAARRRELVTVMTDLGATRGQAAGKIADEAAMLGLQAGLVGGVLAGLAALVALVVVMPHPSMAGLRALILPLDLVPIVAAPIVAALAAGAGAHAAAAYFHSKAARVG